MTIDDIDIEAAILNARKALNENSSVDPGLRALMEMLILIIALLCKRLKLNSKNSSIPPSKDPNREKTPKSRSSRKSGGQEGHIGKTLKRVDSPDTVIELSVDQTTLPEGQYQRIGTQSRQVFDFEIKTIVTEYQAEILRSEDGKVYTAPFPFGVSKAVQYGAGIKANAVYMNCYQMVPLARIKDHFQDQLGLPVSDGSVYNFSLQAYDYLEPFEAWVTEKLLNSEILHADETGFNEKGKLKWLHVLCNKNYTLLHADDKRGTEAMDRMNVLPYYLGKLSHDHWKPYFKYSCFHNLCNAHHLRELTFAEEVEEQKWAGKLKELLINANKEVLDNHGLLPDKRAREIETKYREILAAGELESPPPPPKKKGQRGRAKRSKSRNLLERLMNYETETLRFTEDSEVPFTNNQGERDLRMTKVQQKVSGCFRSRKGAEVFARIRSYISTCQKHDVSSTEALTLLFKGQWPDFMQNDFQDAK